ncbi:DUF4145 domain-containing protein [Akkermansia sp.]|uniref:DUF4145 domain-containing protein n=1 Tax=Akkermansia sp. TaxID=1872421 RepID=UPI0025BD3B65|nr:DUF4145 domain-containing protein [Akkermansia sp.]
MKKKMLCGTCGTKTNCKTIIYDSNRSCDNDVDDNDPDEVILLVTKCLGCNKYTVSEVTRCDHNIEEDKYGTLHIVPSIKILYPTDYYRNNKTSREKFITSFKTKIEELGSCCPHEILLILQECIRAYENDLNMLTTVGFRMIVESVCQEKEKKGEIPKARRDELLKKGYICEQQKILLEKIWGFGNIAVHQFKPLKNNDIEICFDAIETWLKNIYHLPKIGEKLPPSNSNIR